MTIRQAEEKDFSDILRIYSRAREYMTAHGNPTQWGKSFPPENLIKDDIREKRNYVVEADGGVHGVFAFIPGDDPTYARIEGAWMSDAPYGTRSRFVNRAFLTTESIRMPTTKRCGVRSKKRDLKNAA